MRSVENDLFDNSCDETPRKASSSVEEYSGQQLALLQALGKLNDSLEKMYRGTLQVLKSDNVNKYVLAAHGLRELIKELPQYFGVSQNAHNKQFMSDLRNVCDSWETTKKTTNCFSEKEKEKKDWTGEIDNPLRKHLKKTEEFFSTFKKNNLERKEEVRGLIRTLDPGHGLLPYELEESNVKAIQQMRKYFVRISHHGGCPCDSDFMNRVNKFEHFLLVRLCPRTFEDQDTIDAIISEVEGNV